MKKISIKYWLIQGYIFIIICFVLYFLFSHFDSLKSYLSEMNSAYLITAYFPMFAYFIFLGMIWRSLQMSTEAHKDNCSLFTWFTVYMYGYFGKYVPGKVSIILGRILFLEKYGYSKKSIIIASLYEQLLGLINNALISITLLLVSGKLNADQLGEQLKPAAFFVTCGLIFILSPLFPYLLKMVINIFRHGDVDKSYFLSKRNIIYHLSLYSSVTLLGGLGFILFIKSLYNFPLTWENMSYMVAVVNLAGIISLLAFFVPSGIGVREGVIVLLLKPIIPLDLAVLGAVAYRFFFTSVEIFFFAAVKFFALNQPSLSEDSGLK